LCFVNKWWRPLVYLSLIGGTISNVIVIPLIRREVIDLLAFAAVITAFSPLVAIRAWEKKNVSSE
jgi:hypothetical protein